jgi:hypothetical protein
MTLKTFTKRIFLNFKGKSLFHREWDPITTETGVAKR